MTSPHTMQNLVSTIHDQSGETQYLHLCSNILSANEPLRKGRNGSTKSVFSPDILRFDLTNKCFPLLTTKKMFFKGIVEELLFFIRGDTNSKLLEEKGVKIWTKNTSRQFLDQNFFSLRPEGMMGPMYGFQWRHFNGKYDEQTGRGQGGVDQLKELIDNLKKDPFSRRHLLTDYNPDMARDGVLYPCHSISLQFYVSVDGLFLDAFCFNRSSDVFLGLPFNIASTSLLVRLIAEVTGYTARFVNIALGDAHIYEEHFHAIEEQITRDVYSFPQLEINKKLSSIDDIERLTEKDFTLLNYVCHPPIRAEMIA